MALADLAPAVAPSLSYGPCGWRGGAAPQVGGGGGGLLGGGGGASLESSYLDGQLSRARPLPKLKGLAVTSVAWSPTLRATGFRCAPCLLPPPRAVPAAASTPLIRKGTPVYRPLLAPCDPAAGPSPQVPVPLCLSPSLGPTLFDFPFFLPGSEALLGTDSGAIYELSLEEGKGKERLQLLAELPGEPGPVAGLAQVRNRSRQPQGSWLQQPGLPYIGRRQQRSC